MCYNTYIFEKQVNFKFVNQFYLLLAVEIPCFFILWPEAHQCYIFNLKNNLLNFSDSTSCGTGFIHGQWRLRVSKFRRCILLWAPALCTWIMPPSQKAIACSTHAYLLGNAPGKCICPWITNPVVILWALCLLCIFLWVLIQVGWLWDSVKNINIWWWICNVRIWAPHVVTSLREFQVARSPHIVTSLREFQV